MLGRPVFKQMRKGTKSCRECRRRKVRCTYAHDEDETCEPCVKYDRQCVKQGYTFRKTLTAHVAKAESTIDKFAKYQTHSPDPALSSSSSPTAATQSTAASTASSTKSDRLPDPGKTFEDNNFLKLFEVHPLTKPYKPVYSAPNIQTTVNFDDVDIDDRAKLLSSISNEPLILDVLKSTTSWWTAWRDQLWALRDMAVRQTLTDFVGSKLRNDDAVHVALGLMCLAQSFLMLRPGLDDSSINLTSSPRAIMERIMAVVESVILSTDKYAQREEVIIIILLRGKVFAEDSQARRASVHIQMALRLGQAQGLAISGNPELAPEAVYDHQQFLGGVLEVDRFLCLVFGFPYVKDLHFSDNLAFKALLDQSNSMALRVRALRRITAVVAQQVIDRNAKSSSLRSMESDTGLIVQKLVDARSAMSPEWWDPDYTAQGEDEYQAFESLMTQVWFWTTTMFTFLPAVVSSDDTAAPNSQDYQNCLGAARNLIKVFTTLRNTPSLSVQVCNCDDFMGVIAGCLLLIGWMKGTSSGTDSFGLSSSAATATTTTITTATATQFDQDMYAIDNLKEIYRYRAYEQGGSIAKQGLKVLDTLTSFFEETTTATTATTEPRRYINEIHNSSNVGDGSVGGGIDGVESYSDSTTTGRSDTAWQGDTVAILLPYFGTIYVRLRNKIVKPRDCYSSGRSSRKLEGVDPLDFSTMNLGDDVFASNAVLPWDDWSQFMFDTELDQDWNKSLSDWDLGIPV